MGRWLDGQAGSEGPWRRRDQTNTHSPTGPFQASEKVVALSSVFLICEMVTVNYVITFFRSVQEKLIQQAWVVHILDMKGLALDRLLRSGL